MRACLCCDALLLARRCAAGTRVRTRARAPGYRTCPLVTLATPRVPLAAANAHEFIVPMINGMVKTLPSLTVGGKEFDLVFISRRSCHNVGTRFNVRGLDSVRPQVGRSCLLVL